jgi:hypothetical protein
VACTEARNSRGEQRIHKLSLREVERDSNLGEVGGIGDKKSLTPTQTNNGEPERVGPRSAEDKSVTDKVKDVQECVLYSPER